ncbi:hypothetical protein SAMN05216388_1001222 [Halorientalis persicus]|uniref:Uncharacterized protein n=1 Tax=Halorientalis persicus TaxID=1367881 RepID=A0A1H8DA39_9EURY|nr:hypothetical protein [Halorientalis persicus]SEN03985.1 hypothetical protein SAMN05216388_1001222 [Halorientalis persicus]
MIESLWPATFPVEAVPDGDVLRSHHLIYPLLAAFVSCLRVHDWYPRRDPWLVEGGIVLALFGFLAAWPHRPGLGASLTGIGVALVLAGSLRPLWWQYFPRDQQVAVFLLGAAAADDWISHALGWPTPLDLAFKRWGVEGAAVAVIVLSVVVVIGLRALPRRDYPEPV